MPLTDRAIRAAKPENKTRKLYDANGLYLEVAPRGGKWWRFKYYFGGKEKRLSLGVYPEVSLKEARERRDEARKMVKSFVDPSEHRKELKAAKRAVVENAFEAVGREWHTRVAPNWAESHSGRTLSRIERDVFPEIGAEDVSAITAPMLLAVVRKIEARGALESAHRTLTICGQVVRYAVATGRAERDPTFDLRGALPPVKKKHFAAVTEPKDVAELMRKLDSFVGTPVVRAALLLAPLFIVRPGELRHAEWKDFDLEEGEWRFIVTKTNTPHVVPLSRQAVAILRELHRVTGRRQHVFTNGANPRRPMSHNAVLAAMRRLEIGKDVMSGHGFRAMARTIMDEVFHFKPELIEHQLAHAVRDPNGRAYNRTAHLPERKEMMQKWADYLDQLKAGGKVIPIDRSA